MSGHTPGPWVLLEDRIAAPCDEHFPCEKTIAWLGTKRGDAVLQCSIGKNEIENARLIAAAPDLLEALKDALAIINEHVNLSGKGLGAKLRKCDDAIAKAEGR